MSNQQLPDDLSYVDVNVYGEALVSNGLVTRDAISGVGLVLRGLAWHLPQVWIDTTVISSIASLWLESSGASTTTVWTQSAGAGSSTITTWTDEPRGGIWG